MRIMETREIRTLEQLGEVAESVLSKPASSEEARVLALSGDLGAGKTAFVKQLGTQLGIQEEITSPTFVVMKSYAIPEHPRFRTLTHIDAYRIESPEEMRVLGWDELRADPSRLIAVEWPERIKEIMPKEAEAIALVLEGEVRSITF
jgi:tRNA threonylcarbamoyladenosine biosynthesis protein TsaE